ncbi:MAG TPA: PEGA domain-containing protein [Candidatus Paceibacterota bacterium]|nr:PEGA domain-containing protein [Candidatus Pacearchaeota archaeon]HRZ50451.1 PEGA domain-containing protein [Candidatus Paceibacterota bacterium]HSA36172.1 PEGA domain-containing protein [Candidatus Paceibacterota bacterium]
MLQIDRRIKYLLAGLACFYCLFWAVKNFLNILRPASRASLPLPEITGGPDPYCASGSCREGGEAFFDFTFNTSPANAEFSITFHDGLQKTGIAPFREALPPGRIRLDIKYPGYETLSETLTLREATQKFYHLDRSGQLVHHLLDIESVPSPKALAFSVNGSELWSTMLLNKKRGLGVYSSSDGTHIADIDLDGGGGVELVFSPDGSRVYASQMETARIYEIDASSKTVLRTFDTQSAWTKVVALSLDGKYLYAANWSGNDVSIIDLANGAVAKIATVKTPRGLYATSDAKSLYVAGFASGELEKIDLGSKTGAVIYRTGGAMRHIAADEQKGVLYVSDMAKDAIYEVDLKTDSVKKFADTDHNPNTIALSPDKKILFVSCRGRNAADDDYSVPGPEWGSVLMFDTENSKMIDAIVAGNQPTALSISPDGSKLAFSDFLDSRIEIFSVPPYEKLVSGNGGRSAVYRQELIKK